MGVSISTGNSKMGKIASVSLPSYVTCIECGCWKKCYAHKLERLRPNVRDAYANNLNILTTDPDTYWREVEASIMMNRFFRFHVSGDIPNEKYFLRMVDVIYRNPHCEVLCFTKKFDIGLKMDNPYSLPEAHVRYRDGTTTAKPDAILCGGNCTECAQTSGGCWSLAPGQQVVFMEH